MWRLLVSVAIGVSAAAAFAQDFPSRPVTMIVAFPPGGVADITARPTAFAMEKVLKQRVIIENKPGAAGATGNAYVANAKPDGYTLLMALSSISVIPEAERLQGHKPPYELNQLAPIALISADPVVLVVRKEAPWTTVKDFIEDAKKRPARSATALPGYSVRCTCLTRCSSTPPASRCGMSPTMAADRQCRPCSARRWTPPWADRRR